MAARTNFADCSSLRLKIPILLRCMKGACNVDGLTMLDLSDQTTSRQCYVMGSDGLGETKSGFDRTNVTCSCQSLHREPHLGGSSSLE